MGFPNHTLRSLFSSQASIGCIGAFHNISLDLAGSSTGDELLQPRSLETSHDLMNCVTNQVAIPDCDRRLSLETLPVDILYLLMDQLNVPARRYDIFHPSCSNHLQNLRLLNKHFAMLATGKVFRSVAIGKCRHLIQEELPPCVLDHVKYIAIYPLASEVQDHTWEQLASLESIQGIYYAGCYSAPIGEDLGRFLSTSSKHIREFHLSMTLWSTLNGRLRDYKEVIDLLSSTVKHLWLDFLCSDEDSLKILKFIQSRFCCLESIRLTRMDLECSEVAFEVEWSCTATLRRLAVHDSIVPHRKLAKLAEKLPVLDLLMVKSCVFDDVDYEATFHTQNNGPIHIEPIEW